MRCSPAVSTAPEPQLLLGARGHPARDLGALLEQADHVGGVARVLAPGGGGPHAAPGALGQLHAQLALERGDGGADARLRDVQLLRRRGHRAVPHDREEGGELGVSNGHGRPESIYRLLWVEGAARGPGRSGIWRRIFRDPRVALGCAPCGAGRHGAVRRWRRCGRRPGGPGRPRAQVSSGPRCRATCAPISAPDAVRNFSAITTENAFKWGEMSPRRGVTDFSVTDRMVAWATQASACASAPTTCSGTASSCRTGCPRAVRRSAAPAAHAAHG